MSGSTDERRRLAVVSDAVYPWNTGGKEVRHHELLSRLSRRGFEVTVYTMKWWDGARKIELGGLTYVAICPRLALYAGERRSIWQALVFALCTLRMLTRRFDVLEVDAIPFLQLFPMRIVATVRRVPMVVTWHEFWGTAYWRSYLGLKGQLAGMIESWAIRLPHRIIAASHGTAERLRRAVTGLDVSVVPNGVSLADIFGLTGPESTPPTSAAGPARLIVVGRLLTHKKVDVALHAVARMRAKSVEVVLRVVGEGPEKTALVRLAEDLDVAEFVEFVDFMPEREDMLRAVSAADLMLFPSVREGFGMVALEALSLGTPVVTSDAPDNFARHLVFSGRNGEVCAPEPAAVANGAERILNRLSYYSAGAVESAQGYDWEPLADDVAEVYAR